MKSYILREASAWSNRIYILTNERNVQIATIKILSMAEGAKGSEECTGAAEDCKARENTNHPRNAAQRAAEGIAPTTTLLRPLNLNLHETLQAPTDKPVKPDVIGLSALIHAA